MAGKQKKNILTAPISFGGKKEHKDSTKAKRGKGKGKSVGEKKELTTFDAIRHQKLKLRQEDDIKTFFTRAVLMVVIVLALFNFLFGFHAMENNDMSPKLSSGDLLLYYRLDDDFKAQDLVIYKKDGNSYCGRVIARPGDSVDISEEGNVIVNGSQLIESEIFYHTPLYEDSAYSLPLTLSVNQYYVLGDYREGAKDSRNFGPVNTREISGKVITALRRNGL